MAHQTSLNKLGSYPSRVLAALLFLCSNAYATNSQLPITKTEDPFQQVVPSINLNNQTLIDGLAQLNATTSAAFSVEFPLGRSINAPAPPLRTLNLTIGSGTLTHMLDELCNVDKTFSWRRIDGTVNVFPRDSAQDKSYLFNQTLATVKYAGAPDAQKAVFQTVAQLTGPKQQIAILQSGISIAFARPWTASFKNITVREAIDRIAQQLGPTYGWQFGGGNDFRVITFHQRLMAKPPQNRTHSAS